MDPKRSTRSLVEAAFLSALTVVFCLATIYLPVLGLLTSFFWPVPIVLLGVRHDLRLSVLATVVAGIIVAILAGPLTAISMFLGLGVLGLVLGTAMRQRKAPLTAVGMGAIALLISMLLLFVLSLVVMGINPLDSYLTLYQESMEGTMNLYRRFGISGDNLEQMEDTLAQSLAMMRYLLPMALVAGSLILALLNFLLARSILGRLGVSYPGFAPFSTWHLPRSVLLGYIVGILFLVGSSYSGQELLKHIGVNVQAIFQMAIMIQGLAVAWHFMEQYRLPKGFRLLVVFLTLFTPFFAQGLFFAGLFDLFMDFRRLQV
ncbi:MAG: YybS family protein [bacterium]